MSPPPLPPAAPPASAGTPWEARREGDLLGPLVETTTAVLFRPTAFFATMPTTGGIGAPFGYAVILGYTGLLFQAAYQAFLRVGVGSLLAGLGRRGELGQALAFVQGGVGLMVQVILGPMIVTAGLFLGAGIYHVVLWLLGSARRDFEATFRVVAYGHAVSAFLVLPFCGNVAALVWGIVVVTIGLAAAHGIGTGRALAAVLLPMIVSCCCCGALVGLVIAGIGGIASLASLARFAR
jgi:hypothetical protein